LTIETFLLFFNKILLTFDKSAVTINLSFPREVRTIESLIFFIFGFLAIIMSLFLNPFLKILQKLYRLIGIEVKFSSRSRKIFQTLFLFFSAGLFFIGFFQLS